MMTLDRPARPEIAIILDNGGGVTLQIGAEDGGYQHTYWDPAHAAPDLKAALDGDDALDWDGNEAEEHGWLEPTGDQIRNGGYRVYDAAEFLATPAADVWGRAGQVLRETIS